MQYKDYFNMSIKNLKDAVEISDIITINGLFFRNFGTHEDGSFYAYDSYVGHTLTKDQLDDAKYHINGFWQTDIGGIHCFQLTNVALQ